MAAGSLTDEDVRPFLPLVKKIAAQVAKRTPYHIGLDDLISWGSIGLLDAMRKFDPGRGVKFETYAYTRIGGAIMDGLRGEDWVPASRRQKAREEGEDLPPPLSLDEEWSGDEEGAYTLADLVADPGPGPEDLGEASALWREVDRLPARMATIVRSVFAEGFAPQEIAQRLGVSVSRVSQLKSRALLMLRRAIGEGYRLPSEPAPVPSQEFPCQECSGVFRTQQGLAAHIGKVHRRRGSTNPTPLAVAARAQARRCIVPDCGDMPLAKGVCHRHYDAHRRFVKACGPMPVDEWVKAGCPAPQPAEQPPQREEAPAPEAAPQPAKAAPSPKDHRWWDNGFGAARDLVVAEIEECEARAASLREDLAALDRAKAVFDRVTHRSA